MPFGMLMESLSHMREVGSFLTCLELLQNQDGCILLVRAVYELALGPGARSVHNFGIILRKVNYE